MLRTVSKRTLSLDFIAALISASMRSFKLMISPLLCWYQNIESVLQILNFFYGFFQVFEIFIAIGLDRRQMVVN
ncbi:MAG: hypothetical protein HC786_28770 [Richelia sp. CSU_2_1]|nr:hypothetical protein [Microcoleus sp. SM1_3_4]NJR25827.1 hypothetical protein [Richelia sp. CSU_2_1]